MALAKVTREMLNRARGYELEVSGLLISLHTKCICMHLQLC